MRRNNTHFPLDALIAYVMHERGHIVKPCLALDAAIVTLLTTGEFPQAFSREDVRMWDEHNTDLEPLATAIGRPWQPFNSAVAASEALACLHEWANTHNILDVAIVSIGDEIRNGLSRLASRLDQQLQQHHQPSALRRLGCKRVQTKPTGGNTATVAQTIAVAAHTLLR